MRVSCGIDALDEWIDCVPAFEPDDAPPIEGVIHVVVGSTVAILGEPSACYETERDADERPVRDDAGNHEKAERNHLIECPEQQPLRRVEIPWEGHDFGHKGLACSGSEQSKFAYP